MPPTSESVLLPLKRQGMLCYSVMFAMYFNNGHLLSQWRTASQQKWWWWKKLGDRIKPHSQMKHTERQMSAEITNLLILKYIRQFFTIMARNIYTHTLCPMVNCSVLKWQQVRCIVQLECGELTYTVFLIYQCGRQTWPRVTWHHHMLYGRSH